LDKQSPIIEDIDRQLHRVTSKLKSNNAKLKGLVLQVRGLCRVGAFAITVSGCCWEGQVAR